MGWAWKPRSTGFPAPPRRALAQAMTAPLASMLIGGSSFDDAGHVGQPGPQERLGAGAGVLDVAAEDFAGVPVPQGVGAVGVDGVGAGPVFGDQGFDLLGAVEHAASGDRAAVVGPVDLADGVGEVGAVVVRAAGRAAALPLNDDGRGYVEGAAAGGFDEVR